MNPSPMNRRRFLSSSTMAMASGLLAPGAARSAEAAGSRLRKAYMLNTFPDRKLSILEKFKILKAAGFEGVEPPSHLDTWEVLAAMEATGLAGASVVVNSHWAKPLTDPNPAVREVTVEGLRQALKDAQVYGAASVLLVPGVVNERVSYDDAYTRSQAEIRKVIPLAEKLGVKIAIENVWNNFLLSPLEAARYVDEFDSPMVGFHFDIGNFVHIAWPEQWIRILGKRIAALHIKEFSRAKANSEGTRKGFAVDYLEGDNDWPAIMKALKETGYAGWAIVEPAWHPPGVEAADRVQEISRRLDKILAL